MNRRILAWVLLLLFLGGVTLLVLSFAIGRNELALPGLMLALPVALVLYIVKPFGELPAEHEQTQDSRESDNKRADSGGNPD